MIHYGNYEDKIESSDVTVRVLNGVASTMTTPGAESFDVTSVPDGTEDGDIPICLSRPANLARNNHFGYRRLGRDDVAANDGEAADTPTSTVTELTPVSTVTNALLQARARLATFKKKVNHDTQSIDYIERDSGRIVLRDMGVKICVAEEEPSDEDILSMLVAAQEKFGDQFKLFGSNEFIERCSQIAMVHEIKMQNNEAKDRCGDADDSNNTADDSSSSNAAPRLKI
ncbi:MAG TPA: LPD7 domain-containing protein [Gallionella sp.]